MKAKCVVAHTVTLPGGGFRKYESGVIYDVGDLDEATIKAYFEAPPISPPKGKQTRIITAGEQEG